MNDEQDVCSQTENQGRESQESHSADGGEECLNSSKVLVLQYEGQAKEKEEEVTPIEDLSAVSNGSNSRTVHQRQHNTVKHYIRLP